MSLQYSDAYELRCQLTLASGRTITLERLDQQMTYSGLMEGTPNAKSNNMFINWEFRTAAKQCVAGAEPYLLPPRRRDYCRKPGDMQRLVEARPHHVPEWLPAVRCIGTFNSSVIRRNTQNHMSTLVVIWFQDDFALPIQESSLQQLRSLDWDAVATDFEY